MSEQQAVSAAFGKSRPPAYPRCIDGEAIGHSSLKDIVPGDSGSIHLHLWRADLHGKGHGPHLFCLAVVDFYQRFKLRRIICEPKADDPPPNRLLQRMGFPLISTRIGRSSDLSIICKLSRYDIAEDYLLTHQQKGEFKEP
jgi:RimJ/RimL family protein N-acetyltransferase